MNGSARKSSGRWAHAGRAALVVALVLATGQAVISPAGAATTTPTFARADHQQLGNNHVLADFNGDGRLDVAGQGAQAAAVLLNQGNGTFGARAEFPVADWTQDLAAGDFDRDGRTDLAVTVNNPQTSVSLLRGRGDGTFDPAVNLPNTTGLDSPSVVATDLNGDGRLDLAVAHSFACFTAPCRVGLAMSVLLGNGDGTFQPARDVDVGRGMSRIAVGDLDRDGRTDLAIAGDSSRVYLLRGNGDGTFAQQPTLTLTADTFGVDATDIDIADVNRDLVPDLVVAVALNGSRTAVVLGNGDGTFRAPLILTDPGLRVPHYTAVADLNLDGFLDLAMSQGDGTVGLIQVRNGNGDGTFQGPVQLLVPPPKSSIGGFAIIPGELDGDSRPDLTLGIVGAAPAFAVLLNTTGSTPPAVPGAPSLVSPAQDATPAQPVRLDWNGVTGASAYRVQLDDSSTFSSPLVVDRVVTPSELTAPTLATRQHFWRVRAVNSAGVEGAWSSVRRFTPRAVASAPTLASLAVTPTTVAGGGSVQGTVTLSAAAPTGGAVVSLGVTPAGDAGLPASVTVPAGSTSTTFAVTTAAVSTSRTVTLTAGYADATRTATLTVTPPQSPPSAATLTVTATGRSGERVTSSPAGISVSVGSTRSASFPVGTSVTLSVSNGRDAVWSGACSSGGTARRTCTLTVGGTASVSANVR